MRFNLYKTIAFAAVMCAGTQAIAIQEDLDYAELDAEADGCGCGGGAPAGGAGGCCGGQPPFCKGC